MQTLKKSIQVSASAHKALKFLAVESDTTIAEIVEQLLAAHSKTAKKKAAKTKPKTSGRSRYA